MALEPQQHVSLFLQGQHPSGWDFAVLLGPQQHYGKKSGIVGTWLLPLKRVLLGLQHCNSHWLCCQELVQEQQHWSPSSTEDKGNTVTYSQGDSQVPGIPGSLPHGYHTSWSGYQVLDLSCGVGINGHSLARVIHLILQGVGEGNHMSLD